MAKHVVKILDTVFITHDVKQITLEKPKGYKYTPGQATWVSLNKKGWQTKRSRFTFTSLTSSKTLEFIVKIYESHAGVTQQVGLARRGDSVILDEPFGAITYRGPGFFFAGGAGITPFVAIFRDLYKKKQIDGNTLVYSNHTASDVILPEELTKMLGKNFLNIYTRQHVIGFRERRIDRDTLVTLVQNFDQHFYVCGPVDFVTNLKEILLSLGAKAEYIIV